MDSSSETFLYLSTIGHKTGKFHQIEIWYVEHEGRYYMISEHENASHWVKNINANPAVRFSIGTPENINTVLTDRIGISRIVDATNQLELASIIRTKMQNKYEWNEGLIVEVETNPSAVGWIGYPSLIDYSAVMAGAPQTEQEKIIEYLTETLPDVWRDEYDLMTATSTSVSLINDIEGFSFMFDLSFEVVAQGLVSEENSVEERVVAAFGCSRINDKQRDVARMKGFIGASSKVFGEDYDKGHFIGHSIGGGLDINLFPQNRYINRGWSERGKIYRKMERYGQENPGTFCFSRPIYADKTWKPWMIEYGLLMPDGQLWVERFEN